MDILLDCLSGGGEREVETDSNAREKQVHAKEWVAVDRMMHARAVSRRAETLGLKGIALNVFSCDDGALVHRFDTSGVSDKRLHVASASKLVSGLVLLACVSDGDIRLETTTGDLLGWQGAAGLITLDMLGSMTSGLVADDDTMYSTNHTLETCAQSIGEKPLVSPPGLVFAYKQTDWQVAARMCEVVTGKTWSALFEEKIKVPLGLDSPDLLFCQARCGSSNPTHSFLYGRSIDFVTETRNPLVGGGLQATSHELAEILFVAQGTGSARNGVHIIDAKFLRRMYTDASPSTRMSLQPTTISPLVLLGYRYGFGTWLETGWFRGRHAASHSGVSRVSSPGVYGCVPWIDTQNNFIAIISCEGTTVDTCLFTGGIKLRIHSSLAKAVSSRSATSSSTTQDET